MKLFTALIGQFSSCRRVLFQGLMIPIILSASLTFSQVVYVDKDASGTPEDGTSWANAYRTVTNALTNASAQTLWVADGVYTNGAGANDTFMISNNIIYGGFVGTETLLSQRDVAANPTILDGNGKARRVVTKTTANDAVLDGLTIRNGTNTTANTDGSGIYLTGGNLSLLNCTLTNNTCAQDGAALYLSGASGVHVISNCLFRGNKTIENDGDGAALYFNSGISLNIYDSSFLTNVAKGYGGALELIAVGSTVSITNSIITDNAVTSGDRDGGAIHLTQGNINLFDCTFTNNTSAQDGGALYLSGASGVHVVSNCLFRGNTTIETDGDGAGIHFESGVSIGIYDSSFFANVTKEWGGALRLVAVYSVVTITNTVFGGNIARSAGAVSRDAVYSSLQLLSCVVTNNLGAREGGAAWFGGVHSEYVVSNCTFIGNYTTNTVDGSGGAIHLASGDSLGIYDSSFFANVAATWGGALRLYADYSAVTITNTVFGGNKGKINSGAISLSENNSSFQLLSCVVTNHFAGQHAGAAWFEGTHSEYVVSNCTFIGNYTTNSADGRGGAIYLNSGDSLGIYDSAFSSNYATHGGALRLGAYASTVIITNTSFCVNTSKYEAGACHLTEGNLTMLDCLIAANSNASRSAGAFYITGSAGFGIHVISNCTFLGNSTTVSSYDGGAIYFNAGISLDIFNSTFRTNSTVQNAGAVYINSATAKVRAFDSTFAGNTAGADAGALYFPSVADARYPILREFTRCCFYTNTADNNGGALRVNSMKCMDCVFLENKAGNANDEGGGAVYHVTSYGGRNSTTAALPTTRRTSAVA